MMRIASAGPAGQTVCKTHYVTRAFSGDILNKLGSTGRMRLGQQHLAAARPSMRVW